MKREKMLAMVSVLFGLALTGCVTTMPSSQKVFLYVTENRVVYNGETFTELDRIPDRLLRAGARPENEIILVPQGNVQEIYLKSIIGVCGRRGLPNVIIKERPRATAVTQRRGVGIEHPHGTKPPKFIPPNAKKPPKGLPPPPAKDNRKQGFPEPEKRIIKPPKR